ncbi:MAG: B12-binding domain-containing radical SAM protein [Candidatus Sumerlaeaceae bacterium]
MDVLLIYCDTGSPARYLRCLEAGQYHQVLADAGLKVSSTLLHADRRPEEIVDAFRQAPARLVVFYFDEFNGAASLRLARQLRTQFPDTPLAGVGILPILAPDTIMREGLIDYLLAGEAEIALYELITATMSSADVGTIKNLWWRNNGQIQRNPLRPLQENLDTIPYANRALLDQAPLASPGSERVLFACATRGCIYDCQFCYIPPLKQAYSGKGAFYRMRSPQHLAGEILGELRRRDYGCINFVDEQFPTDKNWLRSLAQRLGPAGVLPFQAVVSLERCDTEVLDLLKAAGCERLVIGIETGNEGFRRRVASRNLGNDRLRSWVAAVRERGIGIVTTNMIGLPLESEPLSQETYALNQEIAPDEVRSCVFQPIEGTPLHQYATDKQYLDTSPESQDPDFTRLTMRLPELSPDNVRSTMYRMHFLNLVQRLRALPPNDGYFDFLRELPRAKFKMSHSAAIDVGVVRRGTPQPFGYLAVETASEVRYALNIAAKSMIRFRLHVPEASLQRLQHARSRLVAEVVWSAGGEEHTLFGRLIGPREAALARSWFECAANGPEQAGTGDLIFRVGSWPESDLKAFVFFGGPQIFDQSALRRRDADSGGVLPSVEPEAPQQQDEVAELREQLEQSLLARAAAEAECNQKIKRVAELQMRILELEKELQSRPQEPAPEAGIGDRLKGMFRK